MTGEYHDDKKPRHSTTMFSKFHHHHHHQTPPLQQHFAISGHQFQLSNNNSEEADSRSRSPAHAITPPRIDTDVSITGNDGASIELVRRPRGRPPGSKNKPKPPVVITREPDYPSMSPYVLELPGGSDIVEAVNLYCRKRNMGLCVLTGSGTVTNVSLRQPTSNPGAGAGATITFHGRFDILSISATVFPSLSSTSSFAKGFTISLAGPQGQVVGGPVAGPLMAGGPVYIIAASFNNPVYHRLPLEDDDDVGNSGSGSPPTGESGGGHNPPLPPVTAADAMSMYSSGHLNSDVIWAPTPRQPPPHQPPY